MDHSRQKTKKYNTSLGVATPKDGYEDKEVKECTQEVKEIPYRLPSIVDNLDDFLELNIPEPEMKCQLYR